MREDLQVERMDFGEGFNKSRRANRRQFFGALPDFTLSSGGNSSLLSKSSAKLSVGAMHWCGFAPTKKAVIALSFAARVLKSRFAFSEFFLPLALSA